MKRYVVALLAAIVALADLRCFGETERCMSGAILDYWARSGESVAQHLCGLRVLSG